MAINFDVLVGKIENDTLRTVLLLAALLATDQMFFKISLAVEHLFLFLIRIDSFEIG